jgi:hypothetical protein
MLFSHVYERFVCTFSLPLLINPGSYKRLFCLHFNMPEQLLAYDHTVDYNLSVSPTGDQLLFYWTWEYIVLAVFIGSCSLVGTLGNMPVLYVYMHKRDRIPTNTFIKVLAMADLAVCSLVMPYTVFYELRMVNSDAICRIVEYIRHVSVFASNFSLVAIALERYVAVCKLSHKLSVQDVNRGILIIIGISCAMAVPAVLIFAVVSTEDIADVQGAIAHAQLDFKYCHFTYTVIGRTGAFVYQSALLAIYCVCVLITVVLYIAIYRYLYLRTQRRHMNNVVSTKCPVVTVDAENEHISLDIMTPASLSFLPPPNTLASVSHPPKGVDEKQYTESVRDVNEESGSTCPMEDTPSLIPPSNPVHTRSRSYSESKGCLVHQRTATMLFLCTVIVVVSWLPFWFDIFGVTHNLVLRYLFFLGNASNPIVYGIVNVNVRAAFKTLWYSATESMRRCCNDVHESRNCSVTIPQTKCVLK